MPKPLELALSVNACKELEHVRDHDADTYMREKAAALLKIAGGQSGRDVALHGLLKPSWCNPIEKLWRWPHQNILHLHRQSGDWPGLKQRVAGTLDQFSTGSPELLRYTGLLLD